jgi:hypothetical protein
MLVKDTFCQYARRFALFKNAFEESDPGELVLLGRGGALPSERVARGSTEARPPGRILFRDELVHRIEQAFG